MRLLVTGGAGFIGSNFIRYIFAERPDWQITAVDALTYAGNRRNLDGLTGPRLSFVEASIGDKPAIEQEVRDCDCVVNFAAETHVDNSILDAQPFVDTNLVGTYQLLEAVRKYKKRLHHISTDEVYGDLGFSPDRKFSESSPYDPRSPYSATKAGADMLVRAWIHTYGVQATISNCSNNYGPYQHVEKVIPRTITNILLGEKPKVYGEGKNVRDWLHVDDHNSAILAILEGGKIGETYLVGSNNERSNKDLIQLILKLMGKKEDDYELVPDRPGHDQRYAIDASKIANELGWQPKYMDFEEGLAQTIDWYKQNTGWWQEAKKITEERYKEAAGKAVA